MNYMRITSEKKSRGSYARGDNKLSTLLKRTKIFASNAYSSSYTIITIGSPQKTKTTKKKNKEKGIVISSINVDLSGMEKKTNKEKMRQRKLKTCGRVI